MGLQPSHCHVFTLCSIVLTEEIKPSVWINLDVMHVKKKILRNDFKQTFNQSSMTRIKLLKRDITLVSKRLLIMKQQTICTFPTIFLNYVFFRTFL